LYADAIISPFGTGLIYTTNTSRLGLGMAELGSAPRGMRRLNRHGVPWISLLATYVIACIFFFPFPSWHKLVGYVSDITVLSYGIGPVVLLILRQRRPDGERPFRLRGAWIVAPLAFIASNWVIFWTGYETVRFMFALIFGIFIVYTLWYFLVQRKPVGEFGWQNAWWVLPYFAGMFVLSWLGPSNLGPAQQGGGHDVLSLGWDMLAVAVLSLIIMFLAIQASLPRDRAETYWEQISQVTIDAEEA
jgi:amino acid transporter